MSEPPCLAQGSRQWKRYTGSDVCFVGVYCVEHLTKPSSGFPDFQLLISDFVEWHVFLNRTKFSVFNGK